MEEPPLAEGLVHLVVQYGVHSQALVLRQDACAVEVDPSRASRLPQQQGQPKRVEPTLAALQGRRDVWEAQQETNDLVPLHHHLHQVGLGHGQEPVRDLLRVFTGDGHELPVLREGRIVGIDHAGRVVTHLLLVPESQHLEAPPLLHPLHDLTEPLWQLRVARQVAGVVVSLLVEAGVLDELVVVGQVVGDTHRRAVLEALDQDAQGVPGQESLRPTHLVQAAAPRPLKASGEERARHTDVFLGLEEAEEGTAATAVGIPPARVQNGEAPDDIGPFECQQENGI